MRCIILQETGHPAPNSARAKQHIGFGLWCVGPYSPTAAAENVYPTIDQLSYEW